MNDTTWERWSIASGFAMLALVVGACTASPSAPEAGPAPAGLTQEDNQGAVTVSITPLNLENPSSTLDFEVTLDTHSVDLSMDLAKLAFIRTDGGKEVLASAWPVGSGHHYKATLSFPALVADGKSLLEGISKLTLVIKDIGVPERVFEWSLAR